MLQPLGDCVLIDPDPAPEYAAYKGYTHLVIPERFEHGPEDRPVWGTILAKGLSCRQPIAVGDHVVFGKWAGARLTHEDRPIILVREDELLAIHQANGH